MSVISLTLAAFHLSALPSEASRTSFDGTAIKFKGAYSPSSTVVDRRGNNYFIASLQTADYSQFDVVLKRSASGKITRLAGGPKRGRTQPGRATDARFNGLRDIALDDKGNLYLADCGNDAVFKVSRSGKLTTIAGKVGKHGKPKPGKATSSRLRCPWAITVDKDQNVFVIDSDAVLKVDRKGTLSVVAGKIGKNGYPTPGPATQSRLGNPVDIAVDESGNLYIVDAAPYALVEKVTPGGELSIIAGTGGVKRPKFGREATESYLGIPGSVAVDSEGLVYIGLSNGLFSTTGTYAVVAKVTRDGKLERFAGRMTKRGRPSPGAALKSKLDSPSGLTFGPKDALYLDFGVAFGAKGSYIVKVTQKGRLSIVQSDFRVR